MIFAKPLLRPFIGRARALFEEDHLVAVVQAKWGKPMTAGELRESARSGTPAFGGVASPRPQAREELLRYRFSYYEDDLRGHGLGPRLHL